MESPSRFTQALRADRVPELLQRGYVATEDAVVLVGDTAMVAKVTDSAGKPWAIRAAIEHGTGLFWERHYRSVSDSLPHSIHEYFPRDIHPVPGGITLVGRKFPAVLMEWIEGPTLFQAVDRAARRGNRDVLAAIAAALRDLSIGLRDSRVTHGDLCADNLMLRPSGDLVCVDLDTLEWPGTRKRMHDVQPHPYRHPGRSGTPAHQDAFALLVMLVSTMLLYDSPGLREAIGSSADAPNPALLFSVDDMREPDQSEAMAIARDHASERGHALLELLTRAANSEAFRSQQLLDQAFDLLHLPDSGQDVDIEAPEVSTPALDAIQEQQLDVAAAVMRLREMYGNQSSAPPKRTGDFAQTWPEPVARREDPMPVIEVWDEEEKETPRPTEVIRRPIERIMRRPMKPADQVLKEEAREARRIDQAIAQHARTHEDAEILELAAKATAANLILEENTRRHIRLARDRTQVRERLNLALERNDRRELSDLAVSGELALLGDTTRESLVKVLQALEWPSLLRALETDDDSLILIWFDEELFEDAKSLPSAMRMRVDLAGRRIEWVTKVREALRNRDAVALEPLVAHEPQDARSRLSEQERRRVRELVNRSRALQELEKSLRTGNTQRIIGALAAVDSTGAVIEDPDMWAAVRRIIDRTELLKSLADAARRDPPDDRKLASLIPQVKAMGVAHDPALRGDLSLDRLEQLVLRGAAARRIRRGIAMDDDRAIRLAAFPDTTGALSLLTAEEQERVDTARARKRVRRIDV